MDIGTFTERLEDIGASDDFYSPDVYISIGGQTVKVENVEYFPETEDSYEAIIIS